ncbi:MAG: Ig-like domain repeat protein, partial [Candidatus Aenigmatarchaeota archaeon]
GFDPVNISSINVNENYSVAVIVTVPVSYPVGTYNGTVNVSAENDDYVNITLNVTVLSNRTWNMTPVYCEKNEDPLIGTACEIDVMNLGNDMINFTISPEEGNYTKVNETNFTVGMGLNYTFNITYNVSDVSYGIYNSSFVVNAVQSDANPDNMTLDVALLPYLPPIINLSIVPNFTDQNSTIEFFVNTTDRSGTNISWTNVTVTTPDSSSNQTTMSLVNTSGNFSQWYLNYTNDLGNTSLRGNYTVTVSAMDNVGNSGNLTENFTIYKKVLLTSTTLSSIYYQGDTGSIYYIIKNATGYGMNGIDVTFNIIDSNGNISYYSNYQTDSEGTISPMPTFTLTSDAPIGNYTLMANYSFYDDVLNQTLDVEDNNTFEVQSRTITVTGLFADLETAVVWYPDNEMRFGILVYNGEGRPVDPDDIILTVYRPDDLIYFSYGIGNMTKQSTGYYTFDYQMDYGTPPGMYLAVLNITQGQFNTAKIKAYRVSQGGPYDVRLSLFENEVPQGTYLDFAIIVENKGSVTQDVFIEYNITDLSGTSYFYQNEVIYHYYYGSEAVLTPAFTNQSFTRQAYVLSNQLEGSYILNAKVTYDYVQPPINANSTFSVIEGTTPEPAPSPTPGGQDTYYIRDETPEIAANILITDYNNNISLARGITRIEKVIVKNNGRVKLNNVSLFLLGIPTEWFSISPERYSTLTPDNSSVFLIEFDIPDNANVGNYKASILAVSGVVSNQKATEINIYSSIKELLENEIRRLEEELINLKVDVKIAEREGKDVSDISSIIETVESYIREAKEDIRNEELESALEKVSSATTLLRKAREFLDLLEIPIPEPFFSIWTILILLIVIIIIVFILVYLRKKKKLKPLLRPYMIHISKLTESVKRKEVDKPKLEEERDKLTRMLKVLEREKSEGMITTNAYNKMRKSLEKKLEEMNKKIR